MPPIRCYWSSLRRPLRWTV